MSEHTPTVEPGGAAESAFETVPPAPLTPPVVPAVPLAAAAPRVITVPRRPAIWGSVAAGLVLLLVGAGLGSAFGHDRFERGGRVFRHQRFTPRDRVQPWGPGSGRMGPGYGYPYQYGGPNVQPAPIYPMPPQGVPPVQPAPAPTKAK